MFIESRPAYICPASCGFVRLFCSSSVTYLGSIGSSEASITLKPRLPTVVSDDPIQPCSITKTTSGFPSTSHVSTPPVQLHLTVCQGTDASKLCIGDSWVKEQLLIHRNVLLRSLATRESQYSCPQIWRRIEVWLLSRKTEGSQRLYYQNRKLSALQEALSRRANDSSVEPLPIAWP